MRMTMKAWDKKHKALIQHLDGYDNACKKANEQIKDNQERLVRSIDHRHDLLDDRNKLLTELQNHKILLEIHNEGLAL